MRSKFDRLSLGFILGIIVPILTLILVYLARFETYTFPSFLRTLVALHALSALLSLTVIPNLLVFFIFIWTNHLYTARGVLGATIIAALIIMLIKYLGLIIPF